MYKALTNIYIHLLHFCISSLLYPPIQHNDKMFNQFWQGTRLMKAVLPFTLVQGAFTTSAPPSRQRWEKHRFFLCQTKNRYPEGL